MNISMLGLGIIGSAWAKNLLDDRQVVRCWNRTPKDFPNFHASILEGVEGANANLCSRGRPTAVQFGLNQITSKLGRVS
jgi:3-hydroxyisobutyrate dehydrogenase-like beta-hydroxyacid dehydrogenase